MGTAAFFLPDIFGVRPYARRYTIRDNHIHDNNKPNTATPDAILSVTTAPSRRVVRSIARSIPP